MANGVTPASVDNLANAYRSALSSADANLDPLDRKILVAIVYESAARTAQWVSTRTQDGHQLEGRLSKFSDDLDSENHVGRGLDAAAKFTVNQATSALTSVAMGKGLPLWLAAIATWAAAAWAWASDVTFNAGRSTGFLFGVALCGALVATLIRVAPHVIASASRTSSSMFAWPGQVGAAPVGVFRTATRDALQAVGAPDPWQPLIVRKLRFIAGAIVFLAAGVLALGALVFIAGFAQGFQDATTVRLPNLINPP